MLPLLGLAIMAAGHAAEASPPLNPFAPPTVWSEGHGPYAQQSTDAPGPTAADRIIPSSLPIDPQRRGIMPTGTIVSRPDAAGRIACWGTNGKVIYKAIVAGGPPSIHTANPKTCGYEQVSGYWTMDRDNVAYFLDGKRQEIIALTHAAADDYSSGFAVAARCPVPAGFLREDHAPVPRSGVSGRLMLRQDGLVGIKLLYSGELVISSRYGQLLVIDRGLRHPVVYDLGEPIDNSMAVDEEGGIYVTTFSGVRRLRWDGARIVPDWSQDIGSRSGSTPTLMGCGPGEDHLLAVTAGDRPMELILIWRGQLPAGASRVAARVAVDYGAGADQARGTENSLMVRGYGALVANWSGLFPHIQERRSGLARYDWDPVRRQLTRSWVAPDISMPNSMQALSAVTGLFYGIGTRQIDGIDTYGMYGIRWADGGVEFFSPLGPVADRANNTIGSGIQIGPERTLITMSPERFFIFRPSVP